MARSPRELGPDDLVLSYFSLAPNHPIEDRVALAASAGFAGIGLYIGQYLALEATGFAPGGLRELLDDNDVALAEIEVIPGLGADGIGGPPAGELEAAAWRMADAFSCRYLQVIGPAELEVSAAATAFGALCDRAGDHGLVVGLEFLPFTDIVDVADARCIVEAADRANGGLCVDIWHHARGANDLPAIADIPAGMITGIQMSDGTNAPLGADYRDDCLTNRVPPGDGEFDVTGFIAALQTSGVAVPWSLEVCSSSGWADPAPHVHRCAAGMRTCLSD